MSQQSSTGIPAGTTLVDKLLLVVYLLWCAAIAALFAVIILKVAF